MLRLLSFAMLLMCGLPLWALADVKPVTLEPIEFSRASLTVVGSQGAVRYTPDMLEALGAHQMRTITPWREQPAKFEGTLLLDVLDASGISDANAILVTAENGYSIRMERRVWELWPVLIATRINGRAHSRRERGPLQFIFPMSSDARTGQGSNASNWVWMAQRIEVAE